MAEDSGGVIRVGEKVHLMVRRLFDGDLRRHFAGEVLALDADLVRLQGNAFVFYPDRNQHVRRNELRTRIISIGDPMLIANLLPPEVEIDRLHYTFEERGLVTDGLDFSLDISEFGSTH